MLNRNDPAREGRAVDCFLGGRNDGYNIGALRAEVLIARLHLQPCYANLLAGLVFGEARHG